MSLKTPLLALFLVCVAVASSSTSPTRKALLPAKPHAVESWEYRWTHHSASRFAMRMMEFIGITIMREIEAPCIPYTTFGEEDTILMDEDCNSVLKKYTRTPQEERTSTATV